MRLHTQIPDSRHCWVRYTWRPWPGSSGLWVDLAKRGLGPAAKTVWEEPAQPAEPLLDVVYLPPADSEDEVRRARLAAAIAEQGIPVVYQVLPGMAAGPRSTLTFFDPLESLLAGDLERLTTAPAGATVVWPLLAGYTDDPRTWQAAFERLGRVDVRSVIGMALELTPAQKRRIVEEAGHAEGFEALFHQAPPSEREFAIAVDRAGLEPFHQRPLPQGPPSLVGNRKLAGELGWIGELWLNLGRSESRGQALFGAARLVDRDKHDITALAREGNLEVVTWLDDRSRAIIGQLVHEGFSTLLTELQQEYLERVEGS